MDFLKKLFPQAFAAGEKDNFVKALILYIVIAVVGAVVGFVVGVFGSVLSIRKFLKV